MTFAQKFPRQSDSKEKLFVYNSHGFVFFCHHCSYPKQNDSPAAAVLLCFVLFLCAFFSSKFLLPKAWEWWVFLKSHGDQQLSKSFLRKEIFEKFFLFELRVRVRVVCWSCSEWWVCREELCFLKLQQVVVSRDILLL